MEDDEKGGRASHLWLNCAWGSFGLLQGPEGRRTCTFQGAAYKYLFRRYNSTYGNERAVEIPIAMAEVRKHPEDQVLEVGNVLAHYYSHHHDVVDNYERADVSRTPILSTSSRKSATT